jgi:hypothetical protein
MFVLQRIRALLLPGSRNLTQAVFGQADPEDLADDRSQLAGRHSAGPPTDSRSGGVATSLDEAKAAFRAAWEATE